jgi:hypothetical protein
MVLQLHTYTMQVAAAAAAAAATIQLPGHLQHRLRESLPQLLLSVDADAPSISRLMLT